MVCCATVGLQDKNNSLGYRFCKMSDAMTCNVIKLMYAKHPIRRQKNVSLQAKK